MRKSQSNKIWEGDRNKRINLVERGEIFEGFNLIYFFNHSFLFCYSLLTRDYQNLLSLGKRIHTRDLTHTSVNTCRLMTVKYAISVLMYCA